MEFNFLKLIFTLRMEEDIADPHLLFAIRTYFAAIFRNNVGCDRENCVKCSVAADCPYDQIFSQAMGPNSSAVKRFQKPPLPFAFELPILPPDTNEGSELEIGLTLIGRSVNHVLHFKKAVESMIGKMGTQLSGFARVVKMESVDYLGNRMVITREGCKDTLDRLYSFPWTVWRKQLFLLTIS